jgi:hypothetical protein
MTAKSSKTSSKRRAAHLSATLPVVVGLALCGGCGGPTAEQAPVHGRVTYQGKAIQQGTIVFHPLPPLIARPAGAEIVDGAYAIKENGPVLGKHRVEIQAYRKTGRKIPDLKGDVSVPNRPLIDETVPILPASFNVESSLTAEIEPGDNTRDFEL